MVTFISHSPEQTEGLGETWGRAATRGLVMALCGDLGAGKTQLVKGLARGLNIPARVHSPTFSLVNIYEGGRLVLYHLDLYRLQAAEQIRAAGLEEYLDAGGVTVVEWGEKWFRPPAGFGAQSETTPEGPQIRRGPPPLIRWVEIVSVGETERRIVYEGPGD